MDLLSPLNLPPYPFKISQRNNKLFLFDELRRKEVVLTPEEWVRQHFVQYLIHQKNYPKALIRIEEGLNLHGRTQRADVVAYNNQGEKILMVECKAPSVAITQQVFNQIARYNMVNRIPLLAVTNGLQHYYCSIDFGLQQFSFITELDAYNAV
jgi:hypothetical protein